MDIFEYEFMRRAFVVGGLLAIILPCIGQSILLKRLSMIGDTLSHASLAGLTIGLAFGFNPILAAVVFCVIAGLSIEFIREKLKSYQEVSVVIILAASIGLAGIFSSLAPNVSSISSYLFGSIVTITDAEYYFVIILCLIILATYLIMYRSLYLTIFDPMNAKILGIRVKLINFLLTLMTGITIAISAKTIGSLIVSSLLVIPVITAMQFAKTYRMTLILSIILSAIFVYGGLVLSYTLNLKPGSVIVLISVVCLFISLIVKKK
ncbi:metal ABC transporter permease [Helcococcus kunzii]|uniref:metal ABC transporter permease n=1 Tax=Helcococcus kunzii TaxID=40091 RepID=UPI0024ACB64B|nr:metal ABC transporter permease [Helcococcus kunzii]